MKETIKTMDSINKIKSCSLKRSKIGRTLAKLRREKIQTKLEMKEETLQLILQKYRIIRDCYEQLYANKIHNLEETDNFLETQPTNTESGRNRKSEQTNN